MAECMKMLILMSLCELQPSDVTRALLGNKLDGTQQAHFSCLCLILTFIEQEQDLCLIYNCILKQTPVPDRINMSASVEMSMCECIDLN